MPKKLNFLGGMQNYDEHTGEYEPALTGANGQVVKDADGDGKAHEGERDFSDPKQADRYKEQERDFDKDGKEIAPKKYTIGSDKQLKGDDREKMNQLVDRMKQEGLNVELVDGWEDYGAGMKWTAPTIHEKGGLFEKEGVWALNPKQWMDYMNGDKTADEIIADMKQDKYQKGWLRKNLHLKVQLKMLIMMF